MIRRNVSIPRIILRYEWLILLAAAPLLIFPNAQRSLALLVVPALWFIRKFHSGRFIDRTPLDWPITVLMLMVLVSLYATYDISQSLPKICGMVLGLAVYYCVINRSTHRNAWAAAAGIFLLGGIGICLVAVLGSQWPGKISFLAWLPGWLPPRISGLPGAETGINPNEVAGALVWAAPITWALFIAGISNVGILRGTLGRWRTVAAVVIAALIAILLTTILALTQSRAAFIGSIFAVLMAMLAFHPGRTRRIAFIAAVVLIAASLAALAAPGPGPDSIENSYGIEAAGQGSIYSLNSMAGRLEIWSRAIYGIQDFAFTGMGMNTFREVVHVLYPLFYTGIDTDIGHAHNTFLQAALDLGIPGLLAYLAVHITAFTMLAQTWRNRNRLPFPEPLSRAFILGLGGGLTAHLIYGMLDAVALGAKPGILWWMMLGLIASLYRKPALRKRIAI